MTPEQLTELQTAWPGPWRNIGSGGAYQYELPPLPSRWEPTAGTIAWAETATVVLRLRRPGHPTFAAHGATFTAAVEKLRAKIADYATDLRGLAAELPPPRDRMTPAQFAELHAVWPGPWRRVADQDDGEDDHELPPNADGWEARAGVAPGDGRVVLILRRRHEAIAWEDETFAACAAAIRSTLGKLAAEGPQ